MSQIDLLHVLKQIQEIQSKLIPNASGRTILPAEMEKILEFERNIGTEFSEDLRNIFLNNTYKFYCENNFEFISFSQMQYSHSRLSQLLDDGKFEGRCEQLIGKGFHNWDSERIQKMYWNKKWIPFAEDSCGNMKCVDLDPGKNGKVGQIIDFDLQERTGPWFCVAYPKISDFVSKQLDYLLSNNYSVDGEHCIEIIN